MQLYGNSGKNLHRRCKGYIGSALQPIKTMVVEIADLQTTINTLPKWLDRNITIGVKPGTADINIDVDGFRDLGWLAIRTANADGSYVNVVGLSTHRINRAYVTNNQNHGIGMANKATRHIFYLRTYCNHLNVWIRRAETVDGLERIIYGVSLPDDLARNMDLILGDNA